MHAFILHIAGLQFTRSRVGAMTPLATVVAIKKDLQCQILSAPQYLAL